MPSQDPPGRRIGTHAVQVLRTYPARRPAYPFAPEGERTIARFYRKAFARARALLYIEDQYFWSRDVGEALADALRRSRELRVIGAPDSVDDDGAIALSRGIAREIEKELEYPGQIKVTVIRESRAVDYAK